MPLQAARSARHAACGNSRSPHPPFIRAAIDTPVNVIALTVFVGLLLVGFFAIIWFASACDPRQFSERDALLPLEPDDKPSPSRKTHP
jgi:hypothetical protein